MTRISRMGDTRQDAYRIAAYITAYEDAEALNACLNALQCQFLAMESSKFWKMRTAWLKTKQKLGSLGQQRVSVPASFV